MGMTGVFISAKPSNLLHITELLYTHFIYKYPGNRTRRPRRYPMEIVNASTMYAMLSAGNQHSGDRFQHVFESVDPRANRKRRREKPGTFLPLYRDSMLPVPAHTTASTVFTNIFF